MSLAQATNPDDEWLPHEKDCPEWCSGGHAVALSEGCGWFDSQEHRGHQLEFTLDDIHNSSGGRLERKGALAGWILSLRQRQLGPNRGWASSPHVLLEARHADLKGYADLALTSGEARVLAAQLLALADVVDLR